MICESLMRVVDAHAQAEAKVKAAEARYVGEKKKTEEAKAR